MNSNILSVKKRDGKMAPFINGYNVWDLKPSEWTYNVRQALLRAYELGKKDAVKEINIDCNFDLNTDWGKI